MDSQHDRERQDDELVQSLEETLAGQATAAPPTPQELSAEHAALVESLSAVRRSNPELEQHLVSHIQQVVKLASFEDFSTRPPATPTTRAQAPAELPTPPGPPQPGEVLLGPGAPYIPPRSQAPPPEAPRSAPEALPPQLSAESHYAPLSLPEAPEGPPRATPPEQSPIDHAAVSRYASARKEQWRATSQPQMHQADLVQDPGIERPPDLTHHIPTMATEMNTSLRSMEMMFRKIVASFNETTRSLSEMQATLNRNGIF